MADLKISALTGATTPLAGTEVLPIVQSSTTVKVSVANLTAGRAIAVTNVVASGELVTTTNDARISMYRSAGTNYFDWASGQPLAFGTQTSQGGAGRVNKVKFTDAGNIEIANGNLVPSTAAKGINFTANTPAAGMTSQLLNWYEEGTFTPVIAGATTAGTQTYSVQVGRYTRIGNRVFYNCRVVMTAKDAATSGSIYVGGLPFTSNATASTFAPGAVSNAGNIDLTAGYTQISAEVQNNGTFIYLGQIGDNVAFSLLTDTALTNTTRISVSGNYMI